MYGQKTHVAWFATKAEMRIIEQLKEKLKRSSNSDLMRYLTMQAAENFLPQRARTSANKAE
jgi:hypothetical protein